MSEEDLYFLEEKKIRKIFETELLSELLFLNYKFRNSEFFEIHGERIYNTLHDQTCYNNDEIEDIKNNALFLLNIRHNIKITDFNNINYEKEY